MYYEEKIINGVLMCRKTPDGDWRQCSIKEMGERILELQNTIIDLKARLRTCANAANGGLERVVMCHCGKEAVANLQMTTHECDPIPVCENCLQENEWKANEVNQHELDKFDGAYGLVTYEVLPLSPDLNQHWSRL